MPVPSKTSEASPTATSIEESLIMLSLSLVEPDPTQPRKASDDKSILELSESIKANGVFHPILVRQGNDDKYIIVSGERRWLASQKAGMENIPARIVHGDYEIIALSENLARKDLLAIEESEAAAKLLSKMQGDNTKAKQKELAAKLGIAESTMSEILKPAELPENIKKEALVSPRWSRFKLLKLSKIRDPQKQNLAFEEMRKAILAKTNGKDVDKIRLDAKSNKESVKKEKEAKATERRVRAVKIHTASLHDRLQKALKEEWDKKERKQLKTDLEKLIDTIQLFLKE